MIQSNNHKWFSASFHRPPSGLVVETKIEDKNGCRNEQKLKFRDNHWWFPDDTMYVYYEPTHWRMCE